MGHGPRGSGSADRGPAYHRGCSRRKRFRNGQFAAVISNRSLEHFEGLEQALDEIRRVIDPNGFLYIAVPDSSTVTDRIY